MSLYAYQRTISQTVYKLIIEILIKNMFVLILIPITQSVYNFAQVTTAELFWCSGAEFDHHILQNCYTRYVLQ